MEEDFVEVHVTCPDCSHEFPIMVQSDRGSTTTICEGCMTHLDVSVDGGEVENVTPE